MSRSQPSSIGTAPAHRLTRIDDDRLARLLAWVERAARIQRLSLGFHLERGLGHEEIARVLGEPTSTVAYLLPPPCARWPHRRPVRWLPSRASPAGTATLPMPVCTATGTARRGGPGHRRRPEQPHGASRDG